MIRIQDTYLLLIIWIIVGSHTFAQRAKYTIESLGQLGESVSGGQAISDDGNFATGFSDQLAFVWNSIVGITNLPTVENQPFNEPWGVNDQGTVAGIAATTFFGSSPLPVTWKNGEAIVLDLPKGQTLGRAYDINNAGEVVGSVNGGSLERAAMFNENSAGLVISQTLPNGGTLNVAYGISENGRIVGSGSDPTNAAVTKGWLLDPSDSTATDIGALGSIGHNSAIAFAVSSNGLITGSSSFNSGVNGRAFLWNDDDGMIEIPLPVGASSASGRGVNDEGWVVGTAGGATSLPFLYDQSGTFLLQDLLLTNDNWDLVSGTSNGAFSISNNGNIVGRGLLDGQLTAFMMHRILIGDTNGDGEISLLDVVGFVDALANGTFEPVVDINCDGSFNLLDVQPFIDLLVGN